MRRFDTDDAFDLQRERRANNIVPPISTTVTLNCPRYFYKPDDVEVDEQPQPAMLTLGEVKTALDRHFGFGKWIAKCYAGSPHYTVYLKGGKRLQPTRVSYQKYRDGYRFWSDKYQIWTPTFEANTAEVGQ